MIFLFKYSFQIFLNFLYYFPILFNDESKYCMHSNLFNRGFYEKEDLDLFAKIQIIENSCIFT